MSKETENLENLQTTNTKDENAPESCDMPSNSSREELNRERLRIEQQLPVKLELLELQRRRCRDHQAASMILEQAVAAMEIAAQEQETLLVSGDFFRRKSSWSSIEGEGSPVVQEEISPRSDEAPLSSKVETSPQLHEVQGGDKVGSSPNTSTEVMENSTRKDVLADALVKAFEKLLNGQEDVKDPPLDSNTSDSELSEVETSSNRDAPSDDEGSTKKENSENLEDASATISSPRSPRNAEPRTTEDAEGGDSETVDNTRTGPVIFKLPPRIENVLTIERFNMSRLLRDEYVDKIRRGRQKLRRMRAKNEERNGELVAKFQGEVKALLEGVEFGERGEGEKVVPQRRRLTTTLSHDSGIADFVEQDKDEVVKKYKELLEKARRDLNRAHRALRAKHFGGEEMKSEIAAMERSAKEAGNDLDELEEKCGDLDDDRSSLLEKIKE